MKSLSSLLPNFLRSIGKDEEISLIFLQALWPQIVGPELGRKSRPCRLSRGTLVLEVETEVWQRQLSEFEDLFIQKVNQTWQSVLVRSVKLVVAG